MRKHTQGWYTFEDGTRFWIYGMSAHERKVEERKHGKIVSYIPTYE